MVSQLYFGYFLLWLCEGGSERTVIISYGLIFFYFWGCTELEEVVPCFFSLFSFFIYLLFYVVDSDVYIRFFFFEGCIA